SLGIGRAARGRRRLARDAGHLLRTERHGCAGVGDDRVPRAAAPRAGPRGRIVAWRAFLGSRRAPPRGLGAGADRSWWCKYVGGVPDVLAGGGARHARAQRSSVWARARLHRVCDYPWLAGRVGPVRRLGGRLPFLLTATLLQVPTF